KGRRIAGRGVSTRADTQGIIEFTSLMTLGIALTCLMFGIFLLVPRPAASPIPTSDNPFYLLAIALIGVVLTFATYAVTIVVAAILATIRNIAQFIEAALAWILRPIRRSWTFASTKAQRVPRGDVGVVDDWLDGP